MTRRINAEGLAHLKRWEGLRLSAYKDVAGIWTIGYGSTGPHVKPGMKITEAQAEKLLRDDLDRFEKAVERLVKVPLTDNQFAALVSFAFNVGTGAFEKSTLLKRLNAGDYDAVPGQLMRWVNAGGRKVQGLVNRRAAEGGLWAKGSFVSSKDIGANPVPEPVVTKENISWGAGILAMMGSMFSGEGPVQYALAGVIVVAVAAGLFLFIRKRVLPN